MTNDAVDQRPGAAGITVSVGALAWGAAATAFVLLRLAFIWNAPVGGFELAGLSGAWQARIGETDARFVPTLFQALSAGLLYLSSSETPSRILALLATCSVPAAVYLLRARLGEAGALLTLLLLAVDAPAIALGASGSAMGFDLPLALWLFVAYTRGDLPDWLWAAAAFALATTGPLPLPLIAAIIAISLLYRRYPTRNQALALSAGTALGIAVASFRFGLGWDGLRVPPFVLFNAGFEQAWSSATAFELSLLYGVPILAAGLAAAVVVSFRAYRATAAAPHTLVLVAWALLALIWLLASSQSQNPLPLVALTLPLALLAGPALAEAAGAAARADWHFARFLVPGAIFAAALAVAQSLRWARADKVGDASERILVAGLLVMAVSALGYVAANRKALPTLLVPALAAALFPLVAGTFGVVLSSPHEALPSPLSPSQARELRNIALETVGSEKGLLVVHPSFEQDITWSFRDSGTIIVASRVPENASILIWPANAPRPEGFNPLDGNWNLMQSPKLPTETPLQYLRWFTNRNSLDITSKAASVYVREKQ
ncbi:MAG: hypothetical protein ABIQ47_06900 [Tepidiformaceae bacterium]